MRKRNRFDLLMPATAAVRFSTISVAICLASTSFADVTLTTTSLETLGADWPTPGAEAQIDTVAPYYPSDLYTPNNGNSYQDQGIAEGADVFAQTFTPTTSFRLAILSYTETGGTSADTIHLFDLGNLGANPVPSSYTPTTPDLFGGGAGLSITDPATAADYIQLTFSGSDQVQLNAGDTYAFELWDPTGGTYLIRPASTTSAPPDGNDPNSGLDGSGNPIPIANGTGNPYLPGDAYHNTTVANATTPRTQLNGAGRDFIFAAYSTAVLPPLQVDMDGGNSDGTELHPTQSGFISWNNLPSAGDSNNSNTPQNGYPNVSSISKSFATSSASSGTVGVTLSSVDLTYSSSGNSYVSDSPDLNSHDQGLGGNSPTAFQALYRDFIVAEPGPTTAAADDGTNHRMEIKFTGLDPNSTYAITFYAYDNGSPNSAYVFTDVTNNPLVYLPTAYSPAANSSFVPGDGSNGTQYAPAGQYIAPGAQDATPNQYDFAVTLDATSDGSGNLIFDETSVVGLASPSNADPVLSGFAVASDNRVWNGNSSTNYSDAGNWNNGSVPNGLGQSANFGSTSNLTINVDVPVTVGRINFSGTGSYTISGSNTITLNDASIDSNISFSDSGRTQINLNGGAANQTISAPLLMMKDTQITVANAGQVLTLSNLKPSQVILTKSGSGTLAVNNVTTNGLNINTGTVQLLPGGGLSQVGSLSITSGATLDVNRDSIAVAYTGASPLSTITSEVTAAFDKGAWDKAGITSSAIRSHPATALAIDDNGSTVTVKYTWVGDADGNGVVNSADAADILTTGTTWQTGDFNYDGKVNSDDWSLYFYGAAVSQGGMIPVPEPACFGLALAALPMFRRRRSI